MWESNPQPLGYESDTLPLDRLHLLLTNTIAVNLPAVSVYNKQYYTLACCSFNNVLSLSLSCVGRSNHFLGLHAEWKKNKSKGSVSVYSAFIVVPHTQGARSGIYGSHSFKGVFQLRFEYDSSAIRGRFDYEGVRDAYVQITPYLPLPRKRSPDCASPDWDGGHLIAAYYSIMYPERMKGLLGLVGWHIADGLPT